MALVTLRQVGGGGDVRDVPMLIDTGADVTLLPRSAVTHVGVKLQSGSVYELVGFDGTKSTADAVDLDLIFQNKAFRGRYLVNDDDHGILGRDVLAALRLLFDGPEQQWAELKVP